MADISVLIYENKVIDQGSVIATVYFYSPSADFVSALLAYPTESVNLGGSIPSGNEYPDATILVHSAFAESYAFSASSTGESVAVSNANQWISYVKSQLTSVVTLIDSKVTAYDTNFSTVSTLVDPT